LFVTLTCLLLEVRKVMAQIRSCPPGRDRDLEEAPRPDNSFVTPLEKSLAARVGAMCMERKPYSLNALANSMNIMIDEVDQLDHYGFGFRLSMTSRHGRVILLNEDDFQSARGMAEMALMTIIQEKGAHSQSSTFTHLPTRRLAIQVGRPYSDFSGDHYAEYLKRSDHVDMAPWVQAEYSEKLDKSGEVCFGRLQNKITCFEFCDIDRLEAKNLIEYADNKNVHLKFTFSQGWRRDYVYTGNVRLYKHDDCLYFTPPRKDLQPMASGIEDSASLEWLVQHLRSWVEEGEINPRQMLSRVNPVVILEEIRLWEVETPPQNIADHLRAIMKGPWSETSANMRGFGACAMKSVHGIYPPNDLIVAAIKVRWAIGEADDLTVLSFIHYLFTHDVVYGRRFKRFKTPWGAALRFLSARARQLAVGYYRPVKVEGLRDKAYANRKNKRDILKAQEHLRGGRTRRKKNAEVVKAQKAVLASMPRNAQEQVAKWVAYCDPPTTTSDRVEYWSADEGDQMPELEACGHPGLECTADTATDESEGERN